MGLRTLASVLALLAGCQEYDVRPAPNDPGDVAPDIEVTPAALSFGPATTGEQVVRSFTVKNVGAKTLDVSELRLDVGEMAFTVLTPGDFDLEPEQEQVVDVAFVPVGELTYGQVMVVSDDPDEPEVPVALEGLGEVPALEITPSTHVFPTICDDQVVLTLENVGLADLVIDGIAYDTASPELSLDQPHALPMTLVPGATADVTVHYLPTAANTAIGQLQVDSNDPRGARTADQTSEASGDTVSEVYVVEADPPIDILFAVDKSGSMSDDVRNLGNAFGAFIAEIDQVTDDWQIGVVTKDSGCFNNGILTVATPSYEQVFLDACTGVQFFGTDLTEQLLELTDNALQASGPGQCNDGFVRGNALLHVIVVSDEPEQSGQPWDHWVTRWQARKSDPSLVMVSAVVDAAAPTGSCGSYGTEYVPAAQNTGGLVLDICNSNWGSFAAQLGAASAAGLETYLLSATPDPATIEVSVDGTTYTTGWSYDANRNAVVIDADLPEGAEVEITYVSIGC